MPDVLALQMAPYFVLENPRPGDPLPQSAAVLGRFSARSFASNGSGNISDRCCRDFVLVISPRTTDRQISSRPVSRSRSSHCNPSASPLSTRTQPVDEGHERLGHRERQLG